MVGNWRAFVLLLLFFASFAVVAQTPYSITPNRGPAAGGQEVIIKGDFGQWPYAIIFGSAAVTAERLDEHTLRAVTPPHPAGNVDIVIFEYDIGIDTGLTYTFRDDPMGALERVLLPIFTPPVQGGHGSEFRTDFRAKNLYENDHILTFGLIENCPIAPNCTWPSDLGFTFGHGKELRPDDVIPWGEPGIFMYVPTEDAASLALQLRVYDVSRDATNFGTEIPVVREHEMFVDEEIVLLGVPTDPRFRNTLRIYATEPTVVTLEIHSEELNGMTQERQVSLVRNASNAFVPAYAQIGDLPVGAGPLRLRIRVAAPPPIGSPVIAPPPAVWAFVTVTNNDTQHITVISPQR